MKILLDENFPLPLYHRLREAGHEVEHIIVLGQRGVSDSVIRQRLITEELLFLTQDTEFLDARGYRSTIIVSRVPQKLSISRRVDIWHNCLERFLSTRPGGMIFELLEDSTMVPWEAKAGS